MVLLLGSLWTPGPGSSTAKKPLRRSAATWALIRKTADFVTGWWYNRNLRIYSNLMRITESPDDRILVIYGTSHIPILRHCVEMSYLHELVPVSMYL